jgi:hypothetical protein
MPQARSLPRSSGLAVLGSCRTSTNRRVSRGCNLTTRGSEPASFSGSSRCSVSRSMSCARREFDSPMLAIASVQLRIRRSASSMRRRTVAVSPPCRLRSRASSSPKRLKVYSTTSWPAGLRAVAPRESAAQSADCSRKRGHHGRRASSSHKANHRASFH